MILARGKRKPLYDKVIFRRFKAGDIIGYNPKVYKRLQYGWLNWQS